MRHMLRPHVGARTASPAVLAHWKLDEANATDAAADSISISNLTAVGSPGVVGSLFAVPSASTGARSFNGTSQRFFGSADPSFVSALTGNHSISCVFQVDTVSGGLKTVFAYDGNGEAPDVNALALISTNNTEIRWLWEYDGGINVTQTTSGLGLQVGVSYLVVLSVGDASNGSATSCDVTLYVFEEDGEGLIFEQTWANQARANGGTTAYPGIGATQTSVALQYFDGIIDDVVVWKYPLTREAAFMLYAETFGISYDEETLYDGKATGYHLRVRIANEDGDLVDLTQLSHDHDLLVGATVSDDIDSPGAEATVTVAREIDGFSLAPDVQSSPLNRIGFAYAPLLGIVRRLVIETAVIPESATPNEWDWVPLFDGFTSSINWGPDEIAIQAGDKMGPLFDTFIGKVPTEIATVSQTPSTNYINVLTSTAHGLSVGERVSIYNTANFNGRYTVRTILAVDEFETIETIGGSPAPENDGLLFGPDIDVFGSALGTPVETVMQDIIESNEPSVGYVGGLPTVYTPTSPSFSIKPYFQRRESVQAALETLAQMIGWQIRYTWDPVVRDFRLTFTEPERTKTTPDYTFTNEEIEDIGSASIDAANIRNAVEVIFSDSNGEQDGAGQYPRVLIRREDTASIGGYGYRLCQISEASTSQIDTYDEAFDLAGYVLSDLSEPKAEVTAEIPLRRFVELGDLYRLPADDYHWTTAKDLAVVGYTHTFSDGEAKTSLSLRGKPASGNRKWTDAIVRPGAAPNAPTRSPISPDLAPVIGPALGGAEIASPWNLNDQRRRTLDIFEIHISTTPNFFPDPSTFHSMGRNGTSHIFNLDPATTYYVRTKARDKFGNFSEWSPQSTLVPRYLLSNPAARAYRATSGQAFPADTIDAVVQYNAEDFDERDNYDPANYWFECPVDGIYHVDAKLTLEFASTNAENNTELQIYRANNTPAVLVQGPIYHYDNVQTAPQVIVAVGEVSGIVRASAGDRLQIRANTYGKASDSSFGTASTSTTYVTFHLMSQDDP